MREQSPSFDRPRTVYQLKITLKYISPPIWRRVQVLSDITLAELHAIIQSAMGWFNCHLHDFETRDGREYGVPDEEADLLYGGMLDENDVKLHQLLIAEKASMVYRYDFGDDWEHDIRLEKILPVDPEKHYPVCTSGKRSVPPEDVGGAPGYDIFLKALADPEHKEHDTFVKWNGGEWDVEAFDIEAANAKLHWKDDLSS